MKIYQFIKYDDKTAVTNLLFNPDANTIYCFDLEDSLQDVEQPENNSSIKSVYRKILRDVLRAHCVHLDKIKIGVRINGADTPDYLLDIDMLSGAGYICSIFLPKTESADQVLDLQKRLIERGVNFSEIIPVIETKKGLNNLDEVLKLKSGNVNGVAFGHCDYNLDNGIYPFFHQDDREYWNWVIKIYNKLKIYHLNFVNSPFLKLNEDLLFNDMLSILSSVCGHHFSQITLTRRQTGLCNSFIADPKKTITERVANPLHLSVPLSHAEEFIDSFEKSEKRNGFAITTDRIILSPHEYKLAKQYILKCQFPVLNFAFVGGCFPVKGNVLFEDRFHQLIKKEIENSHDVKFDVQIIRYERYMNCLNRITSSENAHPIDLMVFSIRPEPFLRLAKLYYKYVDIQGGKINHSFNLPFINKISPELHDLLSVDTRFHPTMLGSKSRLRKMLINLNYMLGMAIGNDKYSVIEYLSLVENVIDFCRQKNIQLLILGPAIRTNTFMEMRLSRKLDKFFRKSLSISADRYVSGADLTKEGVSLFEKNGVYVNENYHKLIGERMGKRIMQLQILNLIPV